MIQLVNHRFAVRYLCGLAAAIGLLLQLSYCSAQSPSLQAASITLTLRSKADCPSNVLLLSDLVELQGSDAIVHQIVDLPIAPAPSMDGRQTWSRTSIEKMLQLRGLSADAIRWKGANECEVHRIEGKRKAKSDPSPVATNASPAVANSSQVEPARYNQIVSSSSSLPEKQDVVDRSKFTAPFTTPVTLSVAERVTAEAISSYLQTKTNSNGRWVVNVSVPSEYASLLSQRSKILGVAGGQPPWEGEQDFLFLIKGTSGEQSISIHAEIKLPEMVVAANRPLAKGYVLKEEDLDWIPLPLGSKFSAEECYQSVESVVGQQLRRAVSTQQVIRLTEVGPPTVIHVGDIVQMDVVSGAVVVSTKGRAIEAGGMDDLVQVEIEPNRNRVLARITSEKSVEVISTGARPSKSNARSAQSTQRTINR